jgi:hypothetical protein
MWTSDAAVRGKGVLRAAIFTLETVTSDESPLDEASIDPGLWEHVHPLVTAQRWTTLAATTAYVEDKVRIWAGDPRAAKDGATLVGKGLYAIAFGDAGSLRLGRQAAEHEGWRALGMGLAQAVGNVDRHRIQDRADLRRYALGVLGLGSLLLTQMRYEHPAAVAETEAEAATTPSPTLDEVSAEQPAADGPSLSRC